MTEQSQRAERKISKCKHGEVSAEDGAYLIYESYLKYECERLSTGKDNPTYQKIVRFLVTANTQGLWDTDKQKAIREAVLKVVILKCEYCDEPGTRAPDKQYQRSLANYSTDKRHILIYRQDVSPLIREKSETARYIDDWIGDDWLDLEGWQIPEDD